jgi:hypothetical protein
VGGSEGGEGDEEEIRSVGLVLYGVVCRYARGFL